MTLYYVGIDGGGTSCRARIRDDQGKLIGEAKEWQCQHPIRRGCRDELYR